MSLSGRVAIVTGGGRGIGAAIADELVSRDARLVIVDVADSPEQGVAERHGESVAFVRADVSEPSGRDLAIKIATDRFGGIDLLVNNAVDPSDGGPAADPQTWVNAYEVNVVAAVMLMLACRPSMRQRGGGVVVNIASVSGHRAQQNRWVYNASKAAILQVTRSAARDLAADRIRVVSVTPAWTWSPTLAAMSGNDRERADQLAGQFHALGRVGDAGEVAKAVAFLCSDDASFITGCDVPVDGGYLALGPEG